MNIFDLLSKSKREVLPKGTIPTSLLGSFRRKSITFANGLTDESTVVYWFQSNSFTIDLRLTAKNETDLTQRQGWIGDTQWDEAKQLLSWNVHESYQPRNQWPEPGKLYMIGNSIIELAPSGAYVEDWRQQSHSGPLLGLRIRKMRDNTSGEVFPMEGGMIVAGQHIAFSRARFPWIENKLSGYSTLEEPLALGLVDAFDVENYEVSVALDCTTINFSTSPARLNHQINLNGFYFDNEGELCQDESLDDSKYTIFYDIDCFLPSLEFSNSTLCPESALRWMEQEKLHLAANAVVVT